jgi:hypothetical protein
MNKLIATFYKQVRDCFKNFFEYMSCKTYPEPYEHLRGTVLDNSEDGYFF